MPQITNRSVYAVAFTAASFSCVVAPGETAEIPPDVWKINRARPTTAALIEAGMIHEAGEDPAARVVPTAPGVAGVSEGETPIDAFARLHHRTAVSMVSEMDNLDELEALYVEEKRESVKTAIEHRMESLA